jgi:DNA-binding MarR family transcriptional regulator
MANQKRSKSTSSSVRDLLSWHLHTLAALCSATAALHVERKFELSLLDWRAIAQLGGFAPLSLKDLAKRAGLDKSYASRTIAGLVERDLVRSERNGADARGVMLSLTPAGQRVYQQAFADAVARNENLLEPLTVRQRQELVRMLALLTARARELLEGERRADDGHALAGPGSRARLSKAAAAPANDNLTEIRHLVSKLTDLVRDR